MTWIPFTVTVICRLRGHRKVVWTNGCFDLFHAGHLESLRAASNLGDILIVGINSDNSARANKGDSRPIIPEDQRCAIVNAVKFVSRAFVFDAPTPAGVVKILKPDIFVKGMDWKDKEFPERAIVESYGGRVEFVDSGSDVTTTGIIERCYEVEAQRRLDIAHPINKASIKAFQDNRPL